MDARTWRPVARPRATPRWLVCPEQVLVVANQAQADDDARLRSSSNIISSSNRGTQSGHVARGVDGEDGARAREKACPLNRGATYLATTYLLTSLSWVKEGALALVAKKIIFCRGYQPMT